VASDSYVYTSSGVLRNRKGITDQEKLNRFERRETTLRLVQLRDQLVTGCFDADHLKIIHHHIFQDVYRWAGEFRQAPLLKYEYVGGPIIRFPDARDVPDRVGAALAPLPQQNYFRGSNQAEFADRAATVFSALNAVHPFREGNGRSQREFFRQLAREAGHELDWSVISRERMTEASIQGFKGDPGMMRRVFEEVLDKGRHEPLHQAISFLEQHGKTINFDWNNIYLTSATAGQTYSGRLVGSTGQNFMMRERSIRNSSESIVIGNSDELPTRLRSGDSFSYTAGQTLGRPQVLERARDLYSNHKRTREIDIGNEFGF
jgi:cell filamentation protein